MDKMDEGQKTEKLTSKKYVILLDIPEEILLRFVYFFVECVFDIFFKWSLIGCDCNIKVNI